MSLIWLSLYYLPEQRDHGAAHDVTTLIAGSEVDSEKVQVPHALP